VVGTAPYAGRAQNPPLLYLVPMLSVGMLPGRSASPWTVRGAGDDAERRGRHSDAERRNEGRGDAVGLSEKFEKFPKT
jgi:hypothetical protein